MLPLQNLTTGELLKMTAERFPERAALEYCSQIWNYRELDVQTDELAAGLLALGVKKGARLAIWADTNSNTILLFYATLKIGAIPVMINPGLGVMEIARLLYVARADFLALGENCDSDYLSALLDLFPLKSIPILSIGGRPKAGLLGISELRQNGHKLSPALLTKAMRAVTPEDSALILFTSGTTSEPKAVITSHYARVNSGIQQAYDLDATEQDRFCVAMPLFHCFCISANVMAAIAVGGCLYLPPGRHTADIRDAFKVGHCTILSSVPTMFHALIGRNGFDPKDYATLRIGLIGGSFYPPSLFCKIEQTMGFTLLSSLGQTEATAGITVSSPADSLEIRSTTVGHFMAHVEGKLVDQKNGSNLPYGKSGEICVRGYVVMDGYCGQPGLTKMAIDSAGWLHTGDAGWLDEAGNIHLVARIKKLIIRGGENISPAEVEQYILDDPRIAECKVVGVPDEHYGEEICACVVRVPGMKPTLETLRVSLAGKLADYKLPRYLLCLDQLPRTGMGKVSAHLLLDTIKQKGLLKYSDSSATKFSLN